MGNRVTASVLNANPITMISEHYEVIYKKEEEKGLNLSIHNLPSILNGC